MVYIFSYVVLEAVETVMEVEISGNIYRFLATFFMVAFLPILPRLEKTLALLLFTAVVEAGFSVLIKNGYTDNNRYQEIVILFFVVCMAMSNFVYSQSIKSFELRHELIAANERLQYLTVTDPLTNLYNRRAFSDYIQRIWDECKRNGSAINVLMIDVDDFKKYNDGFGHQKGDDCLVAVTGFLKEYFTRSIDMVARYGGEEFIVLLPYTELEGVALLAEGVCRGVEELRIPNPYSDVAQHVTISVGVASVIPGIEDRYEDFVKLADEALYYAKSNGRNQVCYAPSNFCEPQLVTL